jgi:hypothetical protein
LIFPLKMVIFHSYVSLPEGNPLDRKSQIRGLSHLSLPSLEPDLRYKSI